MWSLVAISAPFVLSFHAGTLNLPAATPAVARATQLAMAAKQTPHGGTLIDLFVADTAAVAATADKTVDITERQSCDVQLLCNGGLSPLTGFLNEDSYNTVVETMKLPDGNILGLPIVMDTDDDSIEPGQKLLLQFQVSEARPAERRHPLPTAPPPRIPTTSVRTHSGHPHGADDRRVQVDAGQASRVRQVLRRWHHRAPGENLARPQTVCPAPAQAPAQQPRSLAHSSQVPDFSRAPPTRVKGVRMVAMERGKYYIGGPLQGLGVPTREFPCATPAEVRDMLPGDVDVVAFQCRNPVHRAHYELFTRALDVRAAPHPSPITAGVPARPSPAVDDGRRIDHRGALFCWRVARRRRTWARMRSSSCTRPAGRRRRTTSPVPCATRRTRC